MQNEKNQNNQNSKLEELKKKLNFSIILIDKPAGPTSFDVSNKVNKILRDFGISKTSHFGTLDPQVIGVLPVAIGRACKLTGFFLGHDKVYIGKMHLHKEISIEELQKVIDKEFSGIIKQLPPKKSRVKRQLREREIKLFQLTKKEGQNFSFETEVQGGTYIRKLCHDLGEKTGLGANMTELRRTRAGIFDDSNLFLLNQLEETIKEAKEGKIEAIAKLDKMLIPAEDAIKQVFEIIELPNNKKSEELVKKLLTGKPIFKQDLDEKEFSKIEEEKFALFFKNKLIEIAKKASEEDKKQGIIARPDFVYN